MFDLVLFAFENGENGDLLIQKAPACTIQTQAEAVCELFGGKKEDIKVIGMCCYLFRNVQVSVTKTSGGGSMIE